MIKKNKPTSLQMCETTMVKYYAIAFSRLMKVIRLTRRTKKGLHPSVLMCKVVYAFKQS